MPQLVVSQNQPEQQIFSLSPGVTLIGRSPDNHIFLLHESVSRRHAQIDIVGGQVVLTDLKSTRGTFVNGIRINSQPLFGGESIYFGEVSCSFSLDSDSNQKANENQKTLVMNPTPLFVRSAEDSLNRSILSYKSEAKRGGRLSIDQKLHTLLQVSLLLSEAEPIDVLLRKILDLVFKLFDASRIFLLLLDEETKELTLRASYPEDQATSYSKSLVQYVREHNVAALFSDVVHDPRFQAAQSVFLMDIQSAMVVPLQVRDHLLGVLYLDTVARTVAYQEEDLEFVAAFANQAAIALENAYLSKKIEQNAILRERFERFFPPAMAREIATSQNPLSTIDTEITALFADISGYTAMVSGMAPRDVITLLNEYFAEISPIIFHHGGMIEKYIGDALLAIWGAPRAQEQDTFHALMSAVEILRTIVAFNKRKDRQNIPPLQIHIGIHSGPVAAGNIGSSSYLQYATIGDTTNVTSRICSVANPNEILISEATWQRISPSPFPCEALPPVLVKGKNEPLQLYRVLWDISLREL